MCVHVCVSVTVCSWVHLWPLCSIRGAFIHDDQLKLKFQWPKEQILPLCAGFVTRVCVSTLSLHSHMSAHVHFRGLFYNIFRYLWMAKCPSLGRKKVIFGGTFDFLWGEREYLSFLLFSSGLECTITEVNYFKIFMSFVVHLNNSATMISDYKQ